MNNNEILECAQSIYEFLIDNSDHTIYKSYNDIPSFKKMNIVLSKYNTDMISFTHFLNSKYIMSNKLLWMKSPKEFFSTTNSHSFYKRIIRNLKLEQLEYARRTRIKNYARLH